MEDSRADTELGTLAMDLWLDFLGRHPSNEDEPFERLCAEHAESAPELRRLRSRAADPGAPAGAALPESSVPERLRRLAQPIARGARFQRTDVIARGGMGVIHRAQDVELDRELALKEMIPRSGEASLATARFLEEAQITAKLDHPGIVPVHEVGMDPEGRLYFAMKLVQGHDLRTILALSREGRGEWPQVRILGVLLKVCDAMAYAHSKGVIHRDLKPANVMVGHFGEVYVMDWGLARAVGRPEMRDLRIRERDLSESLHTERRDEREETPDSPLVTMDGAVVGTPAYMCPEQARGEIQLLSPRSDVYSIGAMLYDLLAGRAPFLPEGRGRASNRTVLARLLDGPPQPIHRLNPQAPQELAAICEKAMAREPERRYRDTLELGEDLRAFLERRVVRAYETGAIAELRKWVERNRAFASSGAAAVVVLVGFLTVALVFKARSDRLAFVAQENAKEAEEQTTIARDNAARAARGEALAQELQERAEKKADEVLRLSALQDLEDLGSAAEGLWPAYPENIGAYEEWIRNARRHVAELPVHRSIRENLRAKALPQSEDERRVETQQHPDYQRWVKLGREVKRVSEAAAKATGDGAVRAADEKLAALEAEWKRLGDQVAQRRDWSFPEEEREARWWNNQLTKLIEGLEDLERGLLTEDGTGADYGWSIPKRLAFARVLAAGLEADAEWVRAWSAALPAIRGAYDGLDLKPQLGLVPIGPDPASGLWEFAHIQTGEPARRGADGRLVPSEATGLVFVLLRGGRFLMGSQKWITGDPNYDPNGAFDEGPVHEVELSPFFLSKYEMTQAQWLRCTGNNPSYYQPPAPIVPSLLHPVEQVSWTTCVKVCQRLGLSLPTEAQWEYAARGGTRSTWSTGDERDSLRGAVNLADQAAARHAVPWPAIEDWPDLDDGFPVHAPVDRFSPNPFGFHNVHGNVWEWCLDGYDAAFYKRKANRDPLADPTGQQRVYRGGSFQNAAASARCALRNRDPFDDASGHRGLRPARRVTP